MGPFTNQVVLPVNGSCCEVRPREFLCVSFLECETRQRLSLSWLQCNTSRLLLVCLDVQVTRVVVVGVVLCVSFFFWRASLLTGRREV